MKTDNIAFSEIFKQIYSKMYGYGFVKTSASVTAKVENIPKYISRESFHTTKVNTVNKLESILDKPEFTYRNAQVTFSVFNNPKHADNRHLIATSAIILEIKPPKDTNITLPELAEQITDKLNERLFEGRKTALFSIAEVSNTLNLIWLFNSPFVFKKAGRTLSKSAKKYKLVGECLKQMILSCFANLKISVQPPSSWVNIPGSRQIKYLDKKLLSKKSTLYTEAAKSEFNTEFLTQHKLEIESRKYRNYDVNKKNYNAYRYENVIYYKGDLYRSNVTWLIPQVEDTFDRYRLYWDFNELASRCVPGWGDEPIQNYDKKGFPFTEKCFLRRKYALEKLAAYCYNQNFSEAMVRLYFSTLLRREMNIPYTDAMEMTDAYNASLLRPLDNNTMGNIFSKIKRHLPMTDDAFCAELGLPGKFLSELNFYRLYDKQEAVKNGSTKTQKIAEQAIMIKEMRLNGASIDEISKKLNISRRTVYNRFKQEDHSERDLEVMERAHDKKISQVITEFDMYSAELKMPKNVTCPQDDIRSMPDFLSRLQLGKGITMYNFLNKIKQKYLRKEMIKEKYTALLSFIFKNYIGKMFYRYNEISDKNIAPETFLGLCKKQFPAIVFNSKDISNYIRDDNRLPFSWWAQNTIGVT